MSVVFHCSNFGGPLILLVIPLVLIVISLKYGFCAKP
jgi:hypothetical protein